ncbi:hypothetical protein SAICODRAFT_20740 [Saitoella complicata NRRL Y-17804]|uniref:Uncharacterized protein n=1 Tax=Saitoella complicata (strain BCRC 22490 / CBS 7301 / JCM 7358 / NBRC 10748 / NRRL Y-17804) TaxID=698492 RepID=A0A0E9NEI8_SAICN|nr:uncharacterized protein SAICODRAFT_20740 [Saitoella complicata NRRL Y-17804]ODQ51374.1 hypothetical protein SAICODRAFT_20740 [Saitoella complicata NRRL Y-17804]GAO48259.1 hypothetical protein G7K_2439-t1 [Saitoella complicata NRRL Y-17804]
MEGAQDILRRSSPHAKPSPTSSLPLGTIDSHQLPMGHTPDLGAAHAPLAQCAAFFTQISAIGATLTFAVIAGLGPWGEANVEYPSSHRRKCVCMAWAMFTLTVILAAVVQMVVTFGSRHRRGEGMVKVVTGVVWMLPLTTSAALGLMAEVVRGYYPTSGIFIYVWLGVVWVGALAVLLMSRL